MKGKTCLITGAAGGIGHATARALRDLGATVVVVDLPDRVSPPGTEFISADLATTEGVRSMVSTFCHRHTRLDVLINNVGLIAPERRVTKEGIEQTFAVNHLAYFSTTLLLLDALQAAPLARIINVSSSHYKAGQIDFDDLQGDRHYNMNRAYCQSKLANVLFTTELARRLKETGVTANCLHPGAIDSGLGDSLRGFWAFMWRVSRPLRKPPERGAEAVMYLASSLEVATMSGHYFVASQARPLSKAAQDEAVARRLWEVSLALTGLDDPTVLRASRR